MNMSKYIYDDGISHGSLESRHPVESCAFQLQTWRPFQLPTGKTLESDSAKPNSGGTGYTGLQGKRPCWSDRTTSFSIGAVLDMSKLSLFDDDRPLTAAHKRLFARKRRRRGSRSLSGRSSDRSGTRRRCCSVGTSRAYGTASDHPMVAGGTDSSGELFVNGGGDANWASDVSEVARNPRRERESNGSGERENVTSGYGQSGNFDSHGNESGYGSEPGYRGDVELGYDDEVDEEEDDSRLLFWGEEFGDSGSKTERVGQNSLQKAHHRCRRKKHDLRMVDPIR
ncbi:Hypothetical predicted protein [Olea europaea subsp. europaea]|uniref:Uncharacterized protein n=1 Tax=Olea europaea subsp. europaea TaxID=158383 RepID=A0A8S0T524_OLEEU|nr:Hypothetical predicted protein [Olea europaea subsp. europaea]